MSASLNNNLSAGRATFQAAIEGGKGYALATTKGAILSLAIGAGLALMTAATHPSGWTVCNPLVRTTVATLGNEAIAGLNDAALFTKGATDKIISVTETLSNFLSHPILPPIYRTALALNIASTCVINARKDVADTSDPVTAGKAVMQNIVRSALSTVCHYACKGALLGAAEPLLERVIPERFQNNFIVNNVVYNTSSTLSEMLCKKAFKQ